MSFTCDPCNGKSKDCTRHGRSFIQKPTSESLRDLLYKNHISLEGNLRGALWRSQCNPVKFSALSAFRCTGVEQRSLFSGPNSALSASLLFAFQMCTLQMLLISPKFILSSYSWKPPTSALTWMNTWKDRKRREEIYLTGTWDKILMSFQ